MASGKEEPGNTWNLKNETGNKLLSEPLGKPYKVSELFIPYTKYEWNRENRPSVHFAQKKLLPWNIEITPFQPRGQWKND